MSVEMAARKPLNTISHLTEEEALLYSEQRLVGTRFREAMLHIVDCKDCRERVQRVKAENGIYPFCDCD